MARKKVNKNKFEKALKPKTRAKISRNKWEPDHDQMLIDLAQQGHGFKVIARKLSSATGVKRSSGSCCSRLGRLRALGIVPPESKLNGSKELSLDLGDEGSVHITLKGKMARSGGIRSKCTALIAEAATGKHV